MTDVAGETAGGSSDEACLTLYRYGWIAWVWRALAVVGFVASVFFVLLAIRFGDPLFLAMAAPLGIPSILLPWMLAVRIDTAASDEIVVTNLFFVGRRIRRQSLGRPRVRRTAQGAVGHIAAPRAWIPVRRGLPIYVDLYADIADPPAFRSLFRLPRTLGPS